MLKPISILFLTAVALAMATPCSAWAAPSTWGTPTPTLNDSEQPGSVIVFPKFIRGVVMTPDQGTLPATDFEIGVTCPSDGTVCASQGVTVRFHWVCPSISGSSSPCQEVDFNVVTTVKGTIHINPENMGSRTTNVPPPPCPEGFLIGWVVNFLGQPIKFDGLIGDALIRGSATASAAYNAVPIQAAAGLATGVSTDVDGDGALDFDGNEYQGVSGAIRGTVRYNSFAAGNLIETDLTLLTLDVLSNRPNNPVYVDLNFYTENEVLHSTATNFTCWEEISLTSIDPGLTNAFAFKGLVESVDAQKVGLFDSDKSGPVTLLGIVLTKERDPISGAILREYAYLLSHDSTPVVTAFKP